MAGKMSEAAPEPELPGQTQPNETAAGDSGPQILDPGAAKKKKGRRGKPGARIEAPGTAYLNVALTEGLGRAATDRKLTTFTPQTVLVARGKADEYYVVPVYGTADMVAEVKYSKDLTTCYIDLYPYLQQSELMVPEDHNWWVPATVVNDPKLGWSVFLNFAERELRPIIRRGPRKPKPQA